MSGTLHPAGCVLVDGRAVLIEGVPGSGKSSLALALIDRGAKLVGDDGVSLSLRDDRLWASPPPVTHGMLEIRNVGIVEMSVGEGPVALLLRLDPEAPRFVEDSGTARILGIEVPVIALFPDAGALPLRAEYALRLYGLAG